MFKSISIAAAFLVATPTISHAGPVTHQPAPAFVLQTYSGAQVALDDYRDRLVVLEWFAADCEFVADHYDDGEGHMPVLQAESIARGVVWLTINSSAHVGSAPQLRALAEELNMKSTDFLSDANGVVGKLYGVRTTPHMVVIDRGTLVYQGAIDDRSSFFGFLQDRSTALNYVRQALTNGWRANPVSVPETKPYGCSIKYND